MLELHIGGSENQTRRLGLIKGQFDSSLRSSLTVIRLAPKQESGRRPEGPTTMSEVLPRRGGRVEWSRLGDLNPGPSVYDTDALPLS